MIALTTYPDMKFSSFNQWQARLILMVSKDIKKFNTYCDSAKLSEKQRQLVLDSITLQELGC